MDTDGFSEMGTGEKKYKEHDARGNTFGVALPGMMSGLWGERRSILLVSVLTVRFSNRWPLS
jgi:hypothetical protein